MNGLLNSLTSFLRGSAGAITVDYVVLTAAATGVAVATSSEIRTGLRTLVGTVNAESTGTALDDPETAGRTYQESFANGAPGWEGASTAEIGGRMSLGPISGSGATESVTRDFLLTEGISHSMISFDMLAMDSLDNESGFIFIGGQKVGQLTKGNEGTSFTSFDVPGIEINAEVIEDNVQLGGQSGAQSWWKDSRTRITIKYDAPDPNLSLGFGSNADQASSDESFAIQDVKVTGLYDPDAPDSGSGNTSSDPSTSFAY